MIRKELHGELGPAPVKRLVPIQDLESRVLIFDLMTHGHKSATPDRVTHAHGEISEDHWFFIPRRYVRQLQFLLRGLMLIKEA